MRATIAILISMLMGAGACAQEGAGIKVGTFQQEVAQFFTEQDGLPATDVTAVALAPDGAVFAGTAQGVARYADGKWAPVEGSPAGPVAFLALAEPGRLLAVAGDALHEWKGGQWAQVAAVPAQKPGVTAFLAQDGLVALGTDQGLFLLKNNAFEPESELNQQIQNGRVASMCTTAELGLVVATDKGIFADGSGKWEPVMPTDGGRSCVIRDAKSVVADSEGRLWIASGHGLARAGAAGNWAFYTGREGLPYNDFTTGAAGEPGVMWFGTTIGAIRYDGKDWEYRQGLLWLPADMVNAIAVNPQTGDAWLATPAGIALIERRPMTLAQKAKFYEEEIDKYHRRTEYGYVLEVLLARPGDKSEFTKHDSDNDGLWTSMYGAGECFAYGATKDPEAKKRAKAAFEALRFLQTVTQGGNPPALPGFIARSVLPTDGPNPNETQYTKEKDIQKKQSDPYWKVLWPRWPTSADGKWYWKCDTSSDELDGHYFFYPLYYDLVADTEEEKERVREVVRGITDHLMSHDFALVDWDGTPTRWAVYGPKEINHNPRWFVERGLNSLSILSYLCAAHHVTGDQKYIDAFDCLVNEHAYDANLTVPKMQNGVGSGNQSDDEMAFMSFYNLLRYCQNPRVKMMGALAFKQYWLLEQPELNPFFNYTFAAACRDIAIEGPWAEYAAAPEGDWLQQSLDTLMRFPINRISWGHKNSHRLDLFLLPRHVFDGRPGRGYRNNGFVLPVDERYFNHWNTDPWQLDYRDGGHELGTGAVYTLPYYMGLYHGFIIETGE